MKDAKTILIIGDSISAGYGIDIDKGWVNLMSKKVSFAVKNISFSGATTMFSRSRAKKAIAELSPDIVIIELGINDSIKGVPIEVMVANMKDMIEESLDIGANVILLDMIASLGYGAKGIAAIDSLTEEYKIKKVRIDIGDLEKEGHILPDGLHPAESAQPIILEKVLPEIK